MRIATTVLVTFLVLGNSELDAEPHVSGRVAEVLVRYPPEGIALAPGDLVWAHTVTPPVAISAGANTKIRIRISGVNLPHGDDVRIEIADGNGQVHDVLDRDRLEGQEDIWSMFIPGQQASLRVRGQDATDGFTFVVDRVLFPFTTVAVESFFGEGQLTDIVEYQGNQADVIKAVATSVAKIDYAVGGHGDTCTAFRIGADLVQTSAHCVATQNVCATTIVQFGFQKNAFGAFDRGQSVRCVEVVAQEGEESADTAILRVTPAPKDEYEIVDFRDHDTDDDEPLFIVQHPGGETKKVSIIDCAVFDNAETEAFLHGFGHSCDTKAGSSGAPVFDLAGRVVGQQRAGHRNPDVTDKPNLATFGSLLRIDSVGLVQDGAPVGIEAAPGGQDSEIPSTAVPLPLPIAPDEPTAPEEPPVSDAPSISSPGSGGSDTIAPDTD
ncbi:trypsin-like serine peptidase [Ruegeria atlantica]|uniref:trypsin-like serine peptidase n=1 Tax=Ruegeria atlantica TaxID=81569 RepID=UPI00249582F7|nr:serine protease [Ruegeria atlantica]